MLSFWATNENCTGNLKIIFNNYKINLLHITTIYIINLETNVKYMKKYSMLHVWNTTIYISYLIGQAWVWSIWCLQKNKCILIKYKTFITNKYVIIVPRSWIKRVDLYISRLHLSDWLHFPTWILFQ